MPVQVYRRVHHSSRIAQARRVGGIPASTGKDLPGAVTPIRKVTLSFDAVTRETQGIVATTVENLEADAITRRKTR